jgi:hypothetical protein
MLESYFLSEKKKAKFNELCFLPLDLPLKMYQLKRSVNGRLDKAMQAASFYLRLA